MTDPKAPGAAKYLVYLLFAFIYVIAFFSVLSIIWLGYLRGAGVIAVAVLLLSWLMGSLMRMQGEIPKGSFAAMMWEGFKALARTRKPNGASQGRAKP